MALNPAALKAKMQLRIYQGLKKNFSADVAKGAGYMAVADASWLKMADAISDSALDIIAEILMDAQVAPGIPTVGSPVSQTTVAPGKII